MREPHPVTNRSAGVLVLPVTKSGQRSGTVGSVAFNDPLVTAAFRAASLAAGQPAPCFQGSPGVFCGFAREAFVACGLDSFYYGPYSLRRGVAIEDFMSCLSVQNTMFRGRRNSFKACNIYVVDGQCALADMKVPPSAARQCCEYAAFLNILM